ncbi:MAG: CPBP family intramembrane glutamic endopeptidase [Myxococcota bacterium]
MSDPQPARRRVRVFPDVPTALLLTIGALLAGGFIGFLFLDLGTLAATAIGTVIGVGGVATLAARRVEEPQAARIGLIGLHARVLPVLLALVPAALLAKELDNLASHWSPPPAVEAAAPAASGSETPEHPEAAPAAETPGAGSDAASGTRPGGDAPAASGKSVVANARAASAADGLDGSGKGAQRSGVAAAERAAEAAAFAELEAPEASVKADPSEVAPKQADPAKQESDKSEAPATTDRAAGDASPATHARDEDDDETELEPLIDPGNPYSLIEGAIFYVGIEPVIHEFLFRGVIQQGLVAQLGLSRGVTLTALLWTMLQPVPATTPARFAAAFVSWFALGWLLGMVRAATGSILGSILLTSLWSAIGLVSIALMDRVPIPGFNVEGTHLPLEVTLASAVLVAVGAWRLVVLARLARGA